MTRYNKIFIQGANGRNNGWGEMVRQLNTANIPVFAAATDGMTLLADLQSYGRLTGVRNRGNFTATKGRDGQRFDFDYRLHANAEAAHAAWQAHAKRTWQRFAEMIPPELDPHFVGLSIENEQRGYVGWGEQYDPDKWEGEIPGFTGWADCVGWQAVYRAREVMANSNHDYYAFAFATGNPEQGAWEQPGMLAYLRLCDQHPDRLGVALHEYSLADDLATGWGYLIGRFQQLHAVCDRHGIKRPSIHIKEFGWRQESTPNYQTMIAQLQSAAALYAAHDNIEGAAIWTTNGSSQWSPANQKVPNLIQADGRFPLADFTRDITYPDPVEPPPPPAECKGQPRVQYKRIYLLLPPSADSSWATAAVGATWDDKRITVGGSADDAGLGALDDKLVLAINPGGWGGDLAAFYAGYYPGTKLETTNAASPDEMYDKLRYWVKNGRFPDPTPPAFRFTFWPTDYWYVTQKFGANPDIYKPHGLPGHEGVDIACPYGTAYYAVADGTVIHASDTSYSNGKPSAYGYHVIVDHGGGFTTLYGHATSNLPVKAGERVKAGQAVGYSGSTGNSSGPHLHLTLQQKGAQLPGWPPNYLDPWPYLEPLFNEPRFPAPPTVMGWAWRGNLRDAGNGRLVAQQQTNFREGPGTNYPPLGKLATGQVMGQSGNTRATLKDTNGYTPGTANIGTPSQPPAQGNPLIGLHASADPGELYGGNVEFAEFRALLAGQPGVIKVLDAHSETAVGRLASDNPGCTFIVRVFQVGWERKISPQQFYEWTLPNTARTVAKLRAVGVKDIWLEIHNEPNLRDEGYLTNWQNGAEFGEWVAAVRQRFATALPGVKMMWPGLSPGHAVAGERYEAGKFLDEAASVIAQFDGVGMHTYWSNAAPEYGLGNALWLVAAYAHRFSRQTVWVTEASRNDRPEVAGVNRPAEYATFFKGLRQWSNVGGVTFFVASASNAYFAPECWIVKGKSRGWGTAVKGLL